MVIIQLSGGLGNQMFQYALGRHLAIKNNSELKLDVTGFSSDPLREYSLDAFNTIQTLATEEEINGLKFGFHNPLLIFTANCINRLSRRFFHKSLIKGPSLCEETVYSFMESTLDARGDMYLQGYWQSEKYFLPIRSILADEFTIPTRPDEKNAAFLEEIRNCDSVSLHVRRGDYIANPKTSSVHQCCSIDYYTEAVKLIRSRVSAPRFFIFSDDPDWAEANLTFGNTRIIRGNEGAKSIEDLRLMSACRHNIIANSSFSWWGAWLNQNPAKTIIAPRKWFKIQQFDSNDRLPQSWLTI